MHKANYLFQHSSIVYHNFGSNQRLSRYLSIRQTDYLWRIRNDFFVKLFHVQIMFSSIKFWSLYWVSVFSLISVICPTINISIRIESWVDYPMDTISPALWWDKRFHGSINPKNNSLSRTYSFSKLREKCQKMGANASRG